MRFNNAIHLFEYPLDETVTIAASDRLPFAADGTYLPNDGQFPTRHELSSEPVLGPDGQPLPGGPRAAKFLRRQSGSDDASVLIPDIGDFIDVGSGQFTISFWARSTSDASNLPGGIVQIRDSAGGVFMLDGNFSNLRGQRGRIASGETEPTYDQAIRTNRTEGPYLINSQWHHYIVAVTGDASTAGFQNMEFYVDGNNYRTTGPGDSQNILATPGVRLAWEKSDTDAFFSRFRIYRGAITSPEAKLLYQEETVGTLVETGKIVALTLQSIAASYPNLSEASTKDDVDSANARPVTLDDAQLDRIAEAAGSSAGDTMRTITATITSAVEEGLFTAIITSAASPVGMVGAIVESAPAAMPFSTVLSNVKKTGDTTYEVRFAHAMPGDIGTSITIRDTPERLATGPGGTWAATPKSDTGY